ncbi:bifunctional metallophosphatase/5'-nucleotidase [Gloeocapsa sp. PCC 73106]|uniref:bifunctional metallophosphatase/5'-nucleotidase n=1 Tax=Gloeocapsa sp. PCC 73106 TaxID=102232 RepID=UPI0002AC3DA6|nr:bifunctional metallophosphatase/5'-nucleotidase [Gloeocapsa sp. PCC 73106]ELR97760.1 5'-nucleotidase/2',3'-cyclic phosphodiesterase-like hydrolase [Gloeocapsa sp. PCC 73106]
MTFTLQILHTSDQEAGIPALRDAIGLSAVMEALEDDYPNSIKLTSGDVYISGPFYGASADIYDFSEQSAVSGIADILIQNAYGWDAAAVGNHEFSASDTGFFNLIAPNPNIRNGEGGGVGIDPAVGYPGTSFPYLASNLDYSGATIPPGLNIVEGGQNAQPNSLTSSVVVDVNGESIGVLGAVTPYLPAIANIGNIRMTTGDNITAATPIATQVEVLIENLTPEVETLVAQGINKIILMTHLQEAEIEQALAQAIVDQNIPIDILMGGGSHRVMASPEDPLRADETQTQPRLLIPYPQEFSGGDNTIYYVNTDANYRYLSQFVPTFDDNGEIISFSEENSQPYATDVAGVDRLYPEAITTFDDVRAQADPEVVAIVDGVGNFVNSLDANIFGQTDVFLNGLRGSVRTEETNLGNLTADSQRFYSQRFLDEYGAELLEGFDEIQLSFKNGGGIRDIIGTSYIEGGTNELIQLPPQANPGVGKEEGDISELDISNSLRFNSGIVVGKVTAAGLYELVEHMVSAVELGSGRFGQISGFKFSFDPSQPARTDTQPGSRIQNLVLTNPEGEGILTIVENGQLLADPNLTFSISTQDFLANGGDSYPTVITDLVELITLEEPNSAADLESGKEQDAFAEFLAAVYNNENGQDPFAVADTSVSEDERIQNLAFREDTIIDDPGTPSPEVPAIVFGTDGDDSFDTEVPGDSNFIGDNQILFTGGGNDTVDITFAPGGTNSRVDLGSGNDLLFAGSNHRILGELGDDVFFLGSGEGNNTVTGAVGSDQFWLVTDAVDLPSTPNVITDFTPGEDVIGFANTSLGFSDLTLNAQGDDIIVNALGQDLAILRNIQVTDLSDANFAFV